LQATHAHDFLLAIPNDGLNQHISSIEYHTILRYRLIFPLFPIDEVCHVFLKAYIDTFREHAFHCKELRGFKYMHDFVRDVLFNVFRWAEVSMKKEAPVSFLSDPLDGTSTLRPTYVMVYVGRRKTCMC